MRPAAGEQRRKSHSPIAHHRAPAAPSLPASLAHCAGLVERDQAGNLVLVSKPFRPAPEPGSLIWCAAILLDLYGPECAAKFFGIAEADRYNGRTPAFSEIAAARRDTALQPSDRRIDWSKYEPTRSRWEKDT